MLAHGAAVTAAQRGSASPARFPVGNKRASMTACRCQPSSRDLLIVGPGVLGSRLGAIWREAHPEATVVAQTNTDGNHARLRSLGFITRTKAEADARKFPFVAFCAPPSGSDDYAGEVRSAAERWDSTGAMVFTGSASVYPEGEHRTEDTPVQAAPGPRVQLLLDAERAVLDAGGNVLRLVGLYHARRGAHTFFLGKGGEVDRSGQRVISLIHYEDAASLAAAVLNASGLSPPAQHRGRVFLGCDDSPIAFQDIIDACVATGAYEGSVTFTGTETPVVKTTDNTQTRQELGWQPKYPSFKEFMAVTKGNDWYTASHA